MASEQEVEKKLGMSLDELIASQAKKKKATGGKPKAAGGRVKKGGAQKVQTKGGGRVLVVPRPKHVPRPSGGLKGTYGGGVRKGGPAPKYHMGGGGGGGVRHMAAQGRQAASRNVKVTIGNKLTGRPPSHIPTSGVLSKPFLGGAGPAGPRGGPGGRAPMAYEQGSNGGGARPAAAGSLAARFDYMGGLAPSSGARAPTGQEPRRNAHGVLIP